MATITQDRQRFWIRPEFIAKTLYKRYDGQYFLHGRGDAYSPYFTHTDEGHTDGEQIDPLTEEDALDWCERREINWAVVTKEFTHLINA